MLIIKGHTLYGTPEEMQGFIELCGPVNNSHGFDIKVEPPPPEEEEPRYAG